MTVRYKQEVLKAIQVDLLSHNLKKQTKCFISMTHTVKLVSWAISWCMCKSSQGVYFPPWHSRCCPAVEHWIPPAPQFKMENRLKRDQNDGIFFLNPRSSTEYSALSTVKSLQWKKNVFRKAGVLLNLLFALDIAGGTFCPFWCGRFHSSIFFFIFFYHPSKNNPTHRENDIAD